MKLIAFTALAGLLVSPAWAKTELEIPEGCKVVEEEGIKKDVHETAQSSGQATGLQVGAVKGAAAGSAAGPVGTVAGGLVGGTVGAVTGKQIGKRVTPKPKQKIVCPEGTAAIEEEPAAPEEQAVSEEAQ